MEAMVKWIYKQLPESATDVMTNLSVEECTGIHESPVPAEPCFEQESIPDMKMMFDNAEAEETRII